MMMRNNLNVVTGTAGVRLLEKAKDAGALFVVNRTGMPGVMPGDNPPGDLNLTITVDNEPVSVKIPNTWIPVDVSTMAPVDRVCVNVHFRRMLQSGYIGIIPPDSVDSVYALLDTPAAQQEDARLKVKSNGGDAEQTRASDAMLSASQQADSPQKDSAGFSMVTDMLNRVSSNEVTIDQAIPVIKAADVLMSDNDIKVLLTLRMPEPLYRTLSDLQARRKKGQATSTISSAAPTAEQPAAV